MKTRLIQLLIVLLLTISRPLSAGIPLAWDDLNPVGSISYYQLYGGPATNMLALLATIPVRATDASPYWFTNHIDPGPYVFTISAVSTNNIKSDPSAPLIIFVPKPVTARIVNQGTNVVVIIGQ